MALDCNTAFGRYLRILRERKRLSLDEVDSLSRSFPESINKGYLSRCENGRQRIAFSKIVALSRIYEVPTEVFAERMELDMELDRVGGPETEGKTFGELSELARKCIQSGAVWQAYGYSRDAGFVATTSELSPRFANHTEQLLISYMNIATTTISLGRTRFAQNELHYIEQTQRLSPSMSAILLERLGVIHHRHKDYAVSRDYLDRAIEAGIGCQANEWIGFFYSSRAALAETEQDHELALELYQKAFRAMRDAGQEQEGARALYYLASNYFRTQRYNAAKRTILSAERYARRHRMDRTIAFLRILLGEVEDAEGKSDLAARRWREAILIGRKNNDRLLRFKAELLLYRQALRRGKTAAARAIERRLKRLSPWVPENAEELLEFKKLLTLRSSPTAKRVATVQPPALPHGNP